MWRELHEVSQARALIEVSHSLSLIDRPRYTWLVRGIGEAPSGGEQDERRPSWNRESRTLFWNGRPVRRVRVMRKPSNIQGILDAFQAADWPRSIPNKGLDQEQLHQALRSLKHRLEGIRFGASEGAKTISWEPL